MSSVSDSIEKQLDEDVKKMHFNDYAIELGVIAGKSNRKNTVNLGINNAELMFIHENGSPLNNIPARPVLQLTIDWANKNVLPETLDRCMDGVLSKNWSEHDVENELQKMCFRIQDHARNIIYDNDGTLAPNSPRVAAKKKGNHPLFDTGQLARSITCRLIKI